MTRGFCIYCQEPGGPVCSRCEYDPPEDGVCKGCGYSLSGGGLCVICKRIERADLDPKELPNGRFQVAA